jgi:hypothetical protein
VTQRQAIVPFLVAALGPPLVVGLFWAYGRGNLPLGPFAVLVGVLGTILAFDIPLCVLILVGYPPTMTLSPLFRSSSERAKWRELRQRPFLSDDEFFERYYSNSSIPRDIPLRLRRIYAKQLGMERVQPDDVATEFDSDIDLWDVLADVQEEFDVDFLMDDARRLDGSFDSVACAVAGKISKQTCGDKLEARYESDGPSRPVR